MKRIFCLALMTGLAFADPALAHDPQKIQKRMEERMRTLGLDVGNAYACTPDDQKKAFRDQARHLFVHVLYDHGEDAAYDYAASVGFGSARDLASINCEERLAYWEDVKETLELEEKE